MTLNNKNIFLFDAVGAIASFIFTGFILPHFSEVLGLSHSILKFLAAFPAVYGIYSLSCYYFFNSPQPWKLQLLILANFIYAVISSGIILFYKPITIWGQALLLAEVLILLIVIYIESKVYRKTVTL